MCFSHLVIVFLATVNYNKIIWISAFAPDVTLEYCILLHPCHMAHSSPSLKTQLKSFLVRKAS